MKLILFLLVLALIFFGLRAFVRSFEKPFEKAHSELKYPILHERVHEGKNYYPISLPKGNWRFDIDGKAKTLIEEDLFKVDLKVHIENWTSSVSLSGHMCKKCFRYADFYHIWKEDGVWYYDEGSELGRTDDDAITSRHIWRSNAFEVKEEEQLINLEVNLKKNLHYNPTVHIKFARPRVALK